VAGLAVDSARQVNTRTLASAERDSALADEGQVSVGKYFEISLEAARVDARGVAFVLVALTEEDVLPHGAVEQPR